MEHRRGAALRLWSQRGGLRQGESRGRGTIPSGRSQHHRRCPIHRGPRLASTHHRSPPGIHESQHPAAGAHTIAFHLTKRHGSCPAPSTIWRVLTRRGFVTPQPQKRPRSSFIRFEADQPNERWQADTTHWKLADSTEVEVLNVLDDHSRLLVASDAYRTTKPADVVATFRKGVATHGFPASVLTDNGAVFTAAPRGGGRCAIELELAALWEDSSVEASGSMTSVEAFSTSSKRLIGGTSPIA